MLTLLNLSGVVERLLINPNRAQGLNTDSVERVHVHYDGFVGDAHSGLTRPSCARVKYLERGTEIRNSRQISVLALEELAEIATRLGINEVKPEWIGANLVLSGLPNLSAIPPGSRLVFTSGVSIVINLENGPCVHPEDVIRAYEPVLKERFVTAASGRRGLTAWVERTGTLTVGERCALHIPTRGAALYP